MPTDREVFRAWAARPEVQALPEKERLDAAARELGFHGVPCPVCEGTGLVKPGCPCGACGGEGEVYVLGRRGQS